MEDPTLMLPVVTTLVGPDDVRADVFDESMRAHLLAAMPPAAGPH